MSRITRPFVTPLLHPRKNPRVLAEIAPICESSRAPADRGRRRALCGRGLPAPHAKPFTQGGGTYARKFSCAASFGPEMPWIEMPEWAGGMHGPDETVPEELLKKAFKIYALDYRPSDGARSVGGLARRVALRSARRGARRITRPLFTLNRPHCVLRCFEMMPHNVQIRDALIYNRPLGVRSAKGAEAASSNTNWEAYMLKAIIVDDEAPARSELKFLLDELGQTEVVAEAASVREAIEKLKEYPCDVMFLDVNMPEATGLQLAEALQHLKFPPAVVFVTAYSEHALDAFKVNAIDYLVKPVETERLSQAISRVREHVSLHVQAQKSERIPVEKGGKKILIGIDKIRFVMARDDYAYLQTDTDRYFSTVSLAQLEKRLDGHGFFRVHRGYLVNLSMVEEIESVSGGTLLLTLNAVDEKIPVSRRRVSALKKALGL